MNDNIIAKDATIIDNSIEIASLQDERKLMETQAQCYKSSVADQERQMQVLSEKVQRQRT